MFGGLLGGLLGGAAGAEDRLGADRRRLGAGLLSLEINTIIKDGITAERMPVLPHALLDIIRDYAEVLLAEPGLDVPELERCLTGRARADAFSTGGTMVTDDAGGSGPPPLPRDERLSRLRQELKPNLDTFSGLRQAAILARLIGNAALEPGFGPKGRERDGLERRMVLLNRIVKNIETVQDVLKRLTDDKLIADLQLTRRELSEKFDPRLPKDLPDAERLLVLGPYTVTPSDFLAVRKVWEIGTEEIVAQTAISLDGDIITRITPLLLRADAKPLLDVHERAVNISVAYWKGLVDTLLVVVDRAIGIIFGGPKK